jgi:hypothetical protein
VLAALAGVLSASGLASANVKVYINPLAVYTTRQYTKKGSGSGLSAQGLEARRAAGRAGEAASQSSRIFNKFSDTRHTRKAPGASCFYTPDSRCA